MKIPKRSLAAFSEKVVDCTKIQGGIDGHTKMWKVYTTMDGDMPIAKDAKFKGHDFKF